MTNTTKDSILDAAKASAQAHGYAGLNFRDIAKQVGIKSASIHYHFPSKADLGLAVAKRYWQDTKKILDRKTEALPDPKDRLRWYPSLFRHALEHDNRMCLCSFMSAEYDALPAALRAEVQIFATVNLEWLERTLRDAGPSSSPPAPAASGAQLTAAQQAQAIFAAVTGAQLLARSRNDISIFDSAIESYRAAGVLPSG
ncbi:TetR/AcrR family transcriptional regulator [Litorivita sp. NS0012-18]|uniref:TetR/AcrR family transcriptional regulator n=1 Tax=Litorivita sp. NS0012-18 TaxID=3127655 RepID=UPI00310A85EE